MVKFFPHPIFLFKKIPTFRYETLQKTNRESLSGPNFKWYN